MSGVLRRVRRQVARSGLSHAAAYDIRLRLGGGPGGPVVSPPSPHIAILSRPAGMVCRETLQRSPVIARVKHLPSGGLL